MNTTVWFHLGAALSAYASSELTAIVREVENEIAPAVDDPQTSAEDYVALARQAGVLDDALFDLKRAIADARNTQASAQTDMQAHIWYRLGIALHIWRETNLALLAHLLGAPPAAALNARTDSGTAVSEMAAQLRKLHETLRDLDRATKEAAHYDTDEPPPSE